MTDYNTVAGSISVTVNQAVPSVSVGPTASAITYGQTLASSTLSGGSAYVVVNGSAVPVPGTFAWSSTTIIPSGGTPSEAVTFTPTDDDRLQHGGRPGERDGEPGCSHRDGDSGLFKHHRHKPTFCDRRGQRRQREQPCRQAPVGLSGGGFFPPVPVSLTNASAQFTIPAGALTVGTDTLTGSYIPDANSNASYKASTGTAQVTVNPAVAYTLTVDSAAPSSGIIDLARLPRRQQRGKLGNNAFHARLQFRHASNSERPALR